MPLSASPLAILNDHVIEDAERYRREFISAEPFPHIVIDDFFAADFAEALLREFPSFEQGNARNEDGQLGRKSAFERIRRLGDHYTRLDDCIKTRAFLTLASRITSVPDLLYDPWYLGGGTHENQEGQSLDAHVDFNYHPSERWHRRLNLIVYLNKQWNADWGGVLELQRDPKTGEGLRRVNPVFNRCVIFETSERSWHGFRAIQLPEDQRSLSRKSIALYFYSRQRPVEHTAAAHSTIYVDRPLPEHFRQGHTLTPQDIDTLRELLGRRDVHIQRQYREISELLEAREKGLIGQLLYLARRVYIRVRR